MELDDAFTKAALYETCVKSKVLRNIDLDSVDTQTLRGLVNKYNALSLREFPIIVSKVLVKFGMTFVTEKMPRLRAYINPNNISVQVEADELAYLERTQSNFQPNIYMIVAKNVAVGMLGTSIQSLHELITATVDTTKTTESDGGAAAVAADARGVNAQKIRVSSVQQTVPDVRTPKRFTRFADSFKSQDVRSPGRSVKQITTDCDRTATALREKQRSATRENRRDRRDAVRGSRRGSAASDDDDDGYTEGEEEDGGGGEAADATAEDVSSTGDARSALAFSRVANVFERSSENARSREVEEAEAVGGTVAVADVEDTDRGVESSDALARVERFIEQSRPTAPAAVHRDTVSQQASRMPSTDSEVLKPLRSINADEFMTLVESNYTSLVDDGNAVGKQQQQTDKRVVTVVGRISLDEEAEEEKRQNDADDDDGFEPYTTRRTALANGPSPHRVPQSRTYDTDSDDERFDDTTGEYGYARSLSSPTPSRPRPQRSLHSDASSVNLTFDDDDDDDNREDVV